MATRFFSPARELVGRAVFKTFQPHMTQCPCYNPLDFMFRVAEVGRSECNILKHRRRNNLAVRVLEDKSHTFAQRPQRCGIVLNRLVVKEQFPRIGRIIPLNIARRVDLPAPFGPTRAIFSFFRIWKLIPQIASMPRG